MRTFLLHLNVLAERIEPITGVLFTEVCALLRKKLVGLQALLELHDDRLCPVLPVGGWFFHLKRCFFHEMLGDVTRFFFFHQRFVK